MLPVLTRKLLRDLWARKGSLAALVLISTIGIGSYVGMASVYRDLDGSRARYYRAQRLADFTVDLKRAPVWAIEQLASLPNVRAIRGRVVAPALIDLPGSDMPISGKAISMPERRAPVLNDVLLKSGVWFTDGDAREAILNEAFASAHGLRPGARIRVLLLDKQHELLVIGTAMSPEFVHSLPEGGGFAPDPARFGVMYLGERFLRRACDQEGSWNQLVGLARDNSRPALDRLLKLVESRLDAFGVVNATPVQEQSSAMYLAEELRGLRISALVIPAIFLGVAALALNVLMARIVAQQRPIIGTLRAVGYSSGALTRHYLSFGVAVGVVGGAAGIALGAWIQSVYVGLYRQFFALPDIVAHFHPGELALGMGIGVGFAALGTVRGVRAAARLEPAEAMRPPPPEKGGRIALERLSFLWQRLSFRSKMILRAVFRNPYRSAVGVIASLVSTALIVATLSLVDSLDYLMKYEFTKVSRQDVTVSLRDPKAGPAVAELAAMPAVADAEGQLVVACDLSNGVWRKRASVTGLPRGNRLYTPLDGAGRPIVTPAAGLVLTRKLAEILRVAPGDTLALRPLIGRRTAVTAPVAGVVDTFFGLSAYAELTYLSRLLGEERSPNVILGLSFLRVASAPFLAAVKRSPTVIGVGERLRSLTQMEETFGKTMGVMIFVMVLFSGLIAFGGVLNIAIVSLSERQRDVGSLRVIGYTPEQVAWIFLGESLMLNGAGIALGLAGGYGLAVLLSSAYNTELYRFPAIVTPSRLAQSVAIMLLFVAAAQAILYAMIRALNWLEALKVKE